MLVILALYLTPASCRVTSGTNLKKTFLNRDAGSFLHFEFSRVVYTMAVVDRLVRKAVSLLHDTDNKVCEQFNSIINSL